MTEASISRRLVAEFVGTAFLLAGIVGSGIMAETLSKDPGLQLFQNAAATAGVLVALILAFGRVSGAHFNPAVTMAALLFGGISVADALRYMVVQMTGAVVGVATANVMFDRSPLEWATTARSGGHLWVAEGVATVGLLVVIFAIVRSGRPEMAAFGVGGYIGGAYYFTSSTSFANPAVTVARTLSDTFTGIDPAHAAAFVVAELLAVPLAVVVIRVVYPNPVVDRRPTP